MSEEEITVIVRSLLIIFQNAEINNKDIELKHIDVFIEALERNYRFIQ